MSASTLDELKSNLRELAAELIRQMENVDSIDLMTLYYAQAQACLVIAKDTKKLKDLFRVVNDGEHTLAKVISTYDN